MLHKMNKDACPECEHIQDEDLDACEKCGFGNEAVHGKLEIHQMADDHFYIRAELTNRLCISVTRLDGDSSFDDAVREAHKMTRTKKYDGYKVYHSGWNESGEFSTLLEQSNDHWHEG